MSRSRSSQRARLLFGLTGLLGAAGCVESSAPRFTVGWDLVYVDVNDRGAFVSCRDAGTPTVELTMINTATQQHHVNTFNCESLGGDSEPLPGGRYSVKIALKNDKGVEMSSLISDTDWTLVRDSLTNLGVITFPIQSFQLSWTLARGQQSLSCQEASAKTVNIITRRNSDPEVVYAFPCEQHSGATTAIAVPGTYSVRVQLVGNSGAVLWDADPMTIPVDDQARAVLPSVVFAL
jgi:hypothetical protein